MKRNDILWKGILENIFSDLLRFFFKDADALFDLEKGFEFLDKELEQLFPTGQVNAPKFVDKLVKVYSIAGDEKWILVHIEVQGYEDKKFGERMFTYFYRILDRYERQITSIALSRMETKISVQLFMSMTISGLNLPFSLILIKLWIRTKLYYCKMIIRSRL